MASNEQYDEEITNYSTLNLDGYPVQSYDLTCDKGLWPGEVENIEVSFDDITNGYADADAIAAPLGWCNNAGIELDRKEDAIKLSISTGDPRGAFVFTVRRMPDGSLIMHVPTPTSNFLHEPLTPLHDGTYQIG
ncbi:MAG: hypothetical protein ACXWQ5_01060 [Ktedonobacterales bacterium]